MIEVRASLIVIADTDELADAALKAMLVPMKGVTIRVVELSRLAT